MCECNDGYAWENNDFDNGKCVLTGKYIYHIFYSYDSLGMPYFNNVALIFYKTGFLHHINQTFKK